MGRIIDRRRVMGGKSLPYDAEIEYLEGDKLSYIDTGIIGGSNVSFQIDFLYKEAYNGYEENIYFLFGSRFDYDNNQFGFITSYRDIWRYGNSRNGNISVNTPRRMVVDNLQHHNVLNLTENNKSVLTVTINYTTFTNNINIIMFGLNSNNNIRLGNGRIYRAKWYVNDIIIRDFIPVRKGTTGYMYDKVSKQLFGNSGTGAFILGPDK